MAGYGDFAYFYDEFNGEADYDALYAFIRERFSGHGLPGPIVADLGCGTGELTLRLARDGYDLIAVDGSPDMLAMLSEKLAEEGREGVLLLEQDLTGLDLYGTIHGAVCTFDTLNHLGPLETMGRAIERAGLFMEKGGLFIFDVNTPYKHCKILGNETFILEDEDAVCVWTNELQEAQRRTRISIDIAYTGDPVHYKECFYEYYCTPQELEALCERHGFRVLEIVDGERFCAPLPDSQRLLFVAEKERQCQS